MSETKIEWCDYTFNPWWGCTRVSPGCENCYAESWAKRFAVEWGPKADRRFFGEDRWAQPLKWNRKAEKLGTRFKVFCASMADVFEDRYQLDTERARLFALILNTPHLDWLLLTKRPENIDRMAPAKWRIQWPGNAWAGTTVEDQQRADERIPHLLEVPAVRFLSVEPMLGPVDIWAYLKGDLRDRSLTALGSEPMPGVDWVIVGGESGPGARPVNEDWIRSLRDQCNAAVVPFFYKQKLDERGRKVSLPMLDGRQWSESLKGVVP